MRRARTTIERFRPRRLATWVAQVRSGLLRPLFSMTVAAWQRARRRLTSPAFVMPPETSRSPDWLREGVSPTQGPTSFDEWKRVGSSTAEPYVPRWEALRSPNSKPSVVRCQGLSGVLKQPLSFNEHPREGPPANVMITLDDIFREILGARHGLCAPRSATVTDLKRLQSHRTFVQLGSRMSTLSECAENQESRKLCRFYGGASSPQR